MRHIFFISLAAVFLSSCMGNNMNMNKTGDSLNITLEQAVKTQVLPDWFFNPSPGRSIGSIGMSRNMSIGANPEDYARKYAVAGILNYYNIRVSDDNKAYKNLIKGDKITGNIGGVAINIPHILKTKDYIIAHAIHMEGISVKYNSDKFISPPKCSPSWICSPASGEYGGAIGVSYRAVSPQRQYEIAIKNGLLLLKYSYGIEVEGEEEFRRIKTGTGSIKIKRNNISASMVGDKESIKVYVKALRYDGETLYLWLVSPDLPVLEAGEKDWISGRTFIGAVGSCRKTSLLSDQINKASYKAVIELAKNKKVDINVEELTRQTSYSSFFDQLITSGVNTRVFPVLKGFYLDKYEKVHVWLVPKQSK